MKNLNETIQRVKDYEPLWDGWTYTGTLIGSGGSGCVLELERGEERSVVKVIYVDDNIERYNAVKNEIETMITLRNNYLVECLDYREEEVFNRRGDKVGNDFLIRMNKYDPFAEYLREEDFDANALCVQLTLEIGIALCVLHSHGILHRDVKPENIFIDRSGKKPHFRLGDFGVSKRISDMSGLTATGTINFMAPESFKYYEYSYRSDIYNFGMTLYYILNDLSFPKYVDEKSQSDIDANTELRLSGERIHAPKYGSALLKKVVLKCCEFKPKDRYADVSEMIGELFGQTIYRAGMQKPQKPLGEESFYRKRVTIKRKTNTAREIAKILFNKKSYVCFLAIIIATMMTIVPGELALYKSSNDTKKHFLHAIQTNNKKQLTEVMKAGCSYTLAESYLKDYYDEIIECYNQNELDYKEAKQLIDNYLNLFDERFDSVYYYADKELSALHSSKNSYESASDSAKSNNIINAIDDYLLVIPRDVNYKKAGEYINNYFDMYLDNEKETIRKKVEEVIEESGYSINDIDEMFQANDNTAKFVYCEAIKDHYRYSNIFNTTQEIQPLDSYKQKIKPYIVYWFKEKQKEYSENDGWTENDINDIITDFDSLKYFDQSYDGELKDIISDYAHITEKFFEEKASSAAIDFHTSESTQNLFEKTKEFFSENTIRLIQEYFKKPEYDFRLHDTINNTNKNANNAVMTNRVSEDLDNYIHEDERNITYYYASYDSSEKQDSIKSYIIFEKTKLLKDYDVDKEFIHYYPFSFSGNISVDKAFNGKITIAASRDDQFYENEFVFDSKNPDPQNYFSISLNEMNYLKLSLETYNVTKDDVLKDTEHKFSGFIIENGIIHSKKTTTN